MISNTNEQVSWSKIACNKYSVTNHTCEVITVSIEGETNNYEYALEIEANATAEFEVPSDGVYKVCINGQNEIVTVEGSEDVLAVKTVVTTIAFTSDEPIDFELVGFNGNTIYDKFIDGAATTAAPANLVAALDTALGAGNHELVPPGVSPNTPFGPIGIDPDNWRLFMAHPTETGDYVQTNSPPLGRTRWEDPQFFCRYQIANFSGANNWLTNLVIDGTDVLDPVLTPFWNRYDMTNGLDVSTFMSHLATYINTTFGFTANIASGPFVIIMPDQELCCPDIEQVTYSQLTIDCDPIVWCDYIYELCAIQTCVTLKLREYLCAECDPCKNDCTQVEKNKRESAKHDAVYLSTLLLHGLIPLIAEDRLSYFGDLIIDDSRIDCVMKIKDLYEKLVDYAKRCGECEECECADCTCCQQNESTCNNC